MTQSRSYCESVIAAGNVAQELWHPHFCWNYMPWKHQDCLRPIVPYQHFSLITEAFLGYEN